MKTTLSLMAFLLSLSAMANFDFKLECQDSKGNQVVDLDVSTNGIADFHFYQETKVLTLSSQYSDYGSLVLAFDDSSNHEKAYQIYLDDMGGANWTGSITDQKDLSVELQCAEKSN